jgi:Fe-S-cluster-containing dehydrogenase component/formate-dependent nitrite reductase membrane component NrfD
MNYGFVIDHRKCIGCHACTVACKSEHQVPVGSFRTWVKYIETGTYPDARRFFSVLRCNHCADAPCVTICPVTALFKRPDGIVDFNGDRCIGCKSCMQACPYDALYINPDTNTAEKCNYCAHRVETGLEPACVIVCPVQAIISGDIDDSTSHISRLIAGEPTTVRKPEAKTQPKLYYIEANQSALVPTDQTHSAGYLWSEAQLDALRLNQESLAAIEADAEAKARTTYDVAHDRPWGWKVSAYLWTKSIAAGAFLLAAIALGFGYVRAHWLYESAAPQVSLIFLLATVGLLVADLKRPERFLRILLWPQWRSWLVIGGYVLVAYGGLLAVWMILPSLGLSALDSIVLGLGGLLGAMTALYSAFLFRQARGRVFWHSPIVPLHLLVQALVGGSAMLLLVLAADALFAGRLLFGPAWTLLQYELIGSLIAHAVLMLGELYMPEAHVETRLAARLITVGIFRRLFWFGSISAGVVLPLALMLSGFGDEPLLAAAASLASLTGLFLWEHIWIQAGQAVPLS